MTTHFTDAADLLFRSFTTLDRLHTEGIISVDEKYACRRGLIREYRVALGLPEEPPSDA